MSALFALAGCATSPGEPAGSPSTETNATGGSRPLDRDVSEYTGFISPTGNIGCAIDMDLARCDIIDHNWSPPPRPPDCELDYGQGIQIVPGQPATFVCAGDTTFGTEDVLQYGDAITAGPLRCQSAESGITCRDADSGHGFTLALEAYRLF